MQNFTMLSMKSAENSTQSFNKKKERYETIQVSYQSPATQMENSKAESNGQETARVGSKFKFCFWILHFSCWASITFFHGFYFSFFV